MTVEGQTTASEGKATRTTSGAFPATTDRLTVIPAEEAWPGGAAGIVRWLRSNPDAIGDLLHVNLSPTDHELPGFDGTVFADRDGGSVLVVVTLGESDDAMLGAMLTRMTATDVRGAVWIVGVARPDHLATLSWLNRSTDTQFHVVRVRAARIGSSNPAPIFDLVLRRPRAEDRAPEGSAHPHPMGRRAEDWGDTTPAEQVTPSS